MATEVTMQDGTHQPLSEHLHDAHQKGTSGYTEEYLANLHRTLHQRDREPAPEHRHPDSGEEDAADPR